MKITICLTLVLLICLAAAGLAKKDLPAHSVGIKDMKFTPTSLTIKVGETVVWTNSDSRDHTVVAEDGSFKSGNMSRGDEFQHTFDERGTFDYGCSYHPRMKGRIVVEK